MFERFTEQARRVLFFARYEASQLGSRSIDSDHLLLGLIREGSGLTQRLFAKSRVSQESLRKDLEGQLVFREKVAMSVELPMGEDTVRVLRLAAEEADRFRHEYIGSEHLVLGLLREERSRAATLLVQKGMRLDAVRETLAKLLSGGGEPSRGSPERIMPDLERMGIKTNRSAPSATVVPVLVYEDVGKAVDWLCRAFGFKERLRAEGPKGVVSHAQLAVGEGALMLGRPGGPFQPARPGEVNQYVIVHVDDVDAHCERAKKAGARILEDPTNRPFGERQYTAEDHTGRRWTFSEHIADVEPEAWGAVRPKSG